MGKAKTALVVLIILPVVVIGSISIVKKSPREITHGINVPVISTSGQTVPDVADIPHAYSVFPRNADHSAAVKLADADDVIARWKAWLQKPTDKIVPFSDYRNARYNLTSINSTDPEFAAALAKAEELDRFGIALANAEIKGVNKPRAPEKAKVALAPLIHTSVVYHRKRGCGSRGGAGYRLPNGRCAGRKR